MTARLMTLPFPVDEALVVTAVGPRRLLTCALEPTAREARGPGPEVLCMAVDLRATETDVPCERVIEIARAVAAGAARGDPLLLARMGRTSSR